MSSCSWPSTVPGPCAEPCGKTPNTKASSASKLVARRSAARANKHSRRAARALAREAEAMPTRDTAAAGPQRTGETPAIEPDTGRSLTRRDLRGRH
ncbi:hypothetical protein B0H03_1205 [Rathayibacter iranicus NCPPB 2253 = VKM Ac-1602]|uniref:Uncharacterized protein n=1 Tax=Rathayibacter iranicus NCPPB 2253 = VKM Ac-1602 TaxID=1328868 RepID=A0ABX5LBM1_9MICO|nr:hypothetical protein B0H03_1205 [Rathayibacter iranicus NCPPB 2253 = VKM Ac-1602]